jgi:hypothetical protein
MPTVVHLNHRDVQLLAYCLWEYRGRSPGSPEQDWYAAEQILAYKAQYPIPAALRCGIDDVATGGGATSGSAFFLLPSVAAVDFSRKAAPLVPPGRGEFHGCEMQPGEENAYEAFLALTRDFIEQHPYSFTCVLGADRTWNSELSDAVGRVCGKVIRSFGPPDPKLKKRLTKLSAPLWSLARLVRLIGNVVKLELDVDTDSLIGGLGGNTVTVGTSMVNGVEILAKLSNAYASRYFGDAPRLAANGSTLRILPSQQSFMVQAADVVGNFGLAHASFALGLKTKRRQSKSEVFERVFGPQPPPTLAGLARLTGDEIEPKVAGNLKFLAADHFYDV